ncbi:MAG: class I SAM-dependent methyltransferase [Bacteroidia bacterium]
MSFDFHGSAQKKFDQQYDNSKTYLLPFIGEKVPITAQTKVMEIGCGEGGVLKAFAEKGAFCLGVDLSAPRIENARGFFPEAVATQQVQFIVKNVYDADFLEKWKGQFDVIILKDAIEHIPNQEEFIPYLKNFLAPKGCIFFGFPPWCMPFGGHQQTCRHKIASKLPYYHLLPVFLYKALLKMFGEEELVIKELLEIKETGISTWRFERIVNKNGFQIIHKIHYLINPIYRYKFGLDPVKQFLPITWLPGLRDFVTTAVYYLIQK